MSIISWIIEKFQKEEEIKWPSDFFFIQFSQVALEMGLKDNRNKIIRRFFINKYGNTEEKRYRYSEERVDALINIHKIPGFDRTKKKVRFPIFASILPGEARFVVSR